MLTFAEILLGERRADGGVYLRAKELGRWVVQGWEASRQWFEGYLRGEVPGRKSHRWKDPDAGACSERSANNKEARMAGESERQGLDSTRQAREAALRPGG